jgi:hypothetical protein
LVFLLFDRVVNVCHFFVLASLWQMGPTTGAIVCWLARTLVQLFTRLNVPLVHVLMGA